MSRTGWTLAGTAAIGPFLQIGRASPSNKLNIGFVGTADRAAADLFQVARLTDLVNVAALCDVNDGYLRAASKKYPRAKTYNDFRRLIDQKDLDAVVVATPDHTHAVATAAALQTGRAVYCEKPLTHTVAECRWIQTFAREQKAVTQLGTQIHAGNNYRRVVELIRAKAIGEVREVHVWVSAVYGKLPIPETRPPLPRGLHWDLWLGPLKYYPYSPEYAPRLWRNWWAFGGGTVSDFGCHFMDLPHWALNLSLPISVEPVDGPPVNPITVPPWLILRYQYPARGPLPPVKIMWYQGGKQPPMLTQDQRTYFRSGVMFVGDKGNLLADYTRRKLLPEAKFKDFQPPPQTIPDSIGHHKEWVEAIINHGPTTCNFGYSGTLTEAVLLGNVAYRVGRRIDWEAASLRAKDCPEADRFIQYRYRRGWEL